MRRFTLRYLLIAAIASLVALTLLAGLRSPARAFQGLEVEFSDPEVELDFPWSMTFHVHARGDVTISKARLVIHEADSAVMTYLDLEVIPGRELDLSRKWSIGKGYPPGTRFNYH